MTSKPDDLEAVRTIVATLEKFEANEQERILRWSREKLNLPTDMGARTHPLPTRTVALPASDLTPSTTHVRPNRMDIKSFVAEKSPSSNNEFAATVAYFYRFEAQESDRKESITADDLQEACRLAGRARLQKPGQTLINAHQVGLIDKADRGSYSISTVGENLVAMTLPSEGKKARKG